MSTPEQRHSEALADAVEASTGAEVSVPRKTGYDESTGTHRGMDWACWASESGHRCGYVLIPEGHALHGIDYGDIYPGIDIDVHGGLTFSGERSTPGWWLGFDCAHFGDAGDRSIMSPNYLAITDRFGGWGGTVRDQGYVERECIHMIDQIIDGKKCDDDE